MKKYLSITVLLLICASAGILLGRLSNRNNSDVAQSSDDRVYANASMKYLEFDEALELSNLIVSGTVRQIDCHAEYDAYQIEISNCIKGEVTGTIEVRNYLTEYVYEYQDEYRTGSTNTNYEVGNEYLFVLEYIDSVYDSEYIIMSDIYIPFSDDAESTIMSSKIDIGDENMSVTAYVEQFKYDSYEEKGALSIGYVDSEDLQEIVRGSKYVLEVKIEELLRETEITDIYYCKVMNAITGDPSVDEDGYIMVPFFKDTVSKGEEYILLLNTDADDSLVYCLSSKNSVRQLSEKSLILELVEQEDTK